MASMYYHSGKFPNPRIFLEEVACIDRWVSVLAPTDNHPACGMIGMGKTIIKENKW